MPRYPTPLTLKVFRSSPGDLPIDDTVSFEPFDKAEDILAARLSNYFHDDQRPPTKKPVSGQLVLTETGEILAEYYLRPDGVVRAPLPGSAPQFISRRV